MTNTSFSENAIFWVEVNKIHPNPYQPRREFDEARLNDLAESLRQYGVLQPLTVTRKEVETESGLHSEYELIAGERRLRASKIAGLSLVPVIIRSSEDNEREKLELSIIENLQREDLNPIDRAEAFNRLATEFNFRHGQIAQKVGKSREYISNSLRLLSLPEEVRVAITSGDLSEGHARPIMMLADKPEEQRTLFREILYKKLTVRDAETIARKIAHERTRKKETKPDPEVTEIEGQLSEHLGTRVSIERKEVGGKIVIDYFSNDDLRTIVEAFQNGTPEAVDTMLDRFARAQEKQEENDAPEEAGVGESEASEAEETQGQQNEQQEDSDDDLYAVRNFTV